MVVAFHYIRELRDAGYEIFHLLLLEGESWPESSISNYSAAMAGQGTFEIAVARSVGFIKQTRTRHSLNHAALAIALDRAKKFEPDLILAFDIFPAWATLEISTRSRIVWLGDLHFETMWAHALYAVRENLRSVIHLPSNWLVCRTWKQVYQRVLKESDQVIAVSAASCGVLARIGIFAEYDPLIWPEIVPVSFDRDPPARPTFLFFGSLGGLGSRSALHFTVNELYPRLCSLWGKNGFSILIVGRGRLPAWFDKVIKNKPEFQYLGFVKDIDALMTRCHAVLVPIDIPIGNRTRILTAMAKGALVIAHVNVAMGNPALVDGETCYLADDGDGFIERMQMAVRDEKASYAIIERARRSYESLFHPDVAGPKMVARVSALIN